MRYKIEMPFRSKSLISRIAALTSAVLTCGCRTASDAPPRLTSSLAQQERLAIGDRVALEHAQLFVPRDFIPGSDAKVPLHLHFQGGVRIAEENFARMEAAGVLIASTLSGRSGAFSRPYSDPSAFRSLLEAGEAEMSRRTGRAIRFAPISISFFSAGYGAVRELLAEPEFYDRITTLISADSIYASVLTAEVRAPQVEQMVDFMRFAQAAARGEKTFVLAHGMHQTPYASTAECADLILAGVSGTRQPVQRWTERGIPIASEAHISGFHLYTFDEQGPDIHVDCLYMIPELARRHSPAGKRAEQQP